MMESMTEIMNKGMKCLTQHLGSIEAEQFISIIIREKFDYTKWQREYFDEMSPERISQEAEKFEQDGPYTGNAVRL